MARKPIRVFLDSTVIISGLLSDKGAPGLILDILSLDLPFIAGITGKYNIIEVERNIARKIPEILSVYNEYLPRLNIKIVPIPPEEQIRRYLGQISDKDVPVLVSAINGKADFLVTGDKKDFEKSRKSDWPLKIVSPAEFMDEILPEVLRAEDYYT